MLIYFFIKIRAFDISETTDSRLSGSGSYLTKKLFDFPPNALRVCFAKLYVNVHIETHPILQKNWLWLLWIAQCWKA